MCSQRNEFILLGRMKRNLFANLSCMLKRSIWRITSALTFQSIEFSLRRHLSIWNAKNPFPYLSLFIALYFVKFAPHAEANSSTWPFVSRRACNLINRRNEQWLNPVLCWLLLCWWKCQTGSTINHSKSTNYFHSPNLSLQQPQFIIIVPFCGVPQEIKIIANNSIHDLFISIWIAFFSS